MALDQPEPDNEVVPTSVRVEPSPRKELISSNNSFGIDTQQQDERCSVTSETADDDSSFGTYELVSSGDDEQIDDTSCSSVKDEEEDEDSVSEPSLCTSYSCYSTARLSTIYEEGESRCDDSCTTTSSSSSSISVPLHDDRWSNNESSRDILKPHDRWHNHEASRGDNLIRPPQAPSHRILEDEGCSSWVDQEIYFVSNRDYLLSLSPHEFDETRRKLGFKLHRIQLQKKLRIPQLFLEDGDSDTGKCHDVQQYGSEEEEERRRRFAYARNVLQESFFRTRLSRKELKRQDERRMRMMMNFILARRKLNKKFKKSKMILSQKHLRLRQHDQTSCPNVRLRQKRLQRDLCLLKWKNRGDAVLNTQSVL